LASLPLSCGIVNADVLAWAAVALPGKEFDRKMRTARPFLIIGALLTACSLIFQPPVTAQSPPDPGLQQMLQGGRDALASRQWGRAIRFFQEAVRESNGACAECYLGLAASYSGNGQLQDAVDASDNALNLSPDAASQATAHTIKGKALVELAAKDRSLLTQAESEFRSAAQIEPANPLFHLFLGTVLLRESPPLQSKTDEGIAELKKCLTLDPPAPVADRAKLMLADPRRAGEAFAPDFRITTVQGEDLSLKQFAGKIVVLDFWATWCPPCRESVPELRALTRKYDPSKLVLISISADEDDDTWRKFIADQKMTWPQYRDADKRLTTAFTIRAYPTYLVIDGDGVITNRIVGADPKQSVVNQLVAILKTMPQLEEGK
jgi:peroxiredoxin/cytochrome c-type biogenesis protein CcmH/NrfG